MKNLQESLFDKDLVTRKIGTLDVITNLISNYGLGSHTIKNWEKCLFEIDKAIKYDYRKGWQLTSQEVSNMEDDELYIHIDVLSNSMPSITLVGYGLTGPTSYKVVPPIVRIAFSPQLDNIYSDIYQTATTDYKTILRSHKFNYYKIDSDETMNFLKNVFKEIESVF